MITDTPEITPWGVADSVRPIINGVFFCSTASHGGYFVSEDTNIRIPNYLRNPGGWYEEDCEWAKAHIGLDIEDEQTERATETLKQWYPDLFERHFAVKVTAKESHILSEREFKERHKDDYVVVSAFGSWHDEVPKGQVGCLAALGGRQDNGGLAQDRRWFLVSSEEYEQRNQHGFVIDLSKHPEIEALT